MTRREFKKKCDKVGRYCFAIGKVQTECVRLFPSHANTESEQGVAEDRGRKIVAWVRILGWRASIAHRIAKTIRSPKVTGDKERQEVVNGSKEIGENSGGVEQTDRDKAGHRSGNTVHVTVEIIEVIKTLKERQTKSRVDSQGKKKLR